jgi:hypothetical protein
MAPTVVARPPGSVNQSDPSRAGAGGDVHLLAGGFAEDGEPGGLAGVGVAVGVSGLGGDLAVTR